MRLDQLMAAAAPADAVTSQALAWQRALAGRGVAGEIYAEHVHPAMAGRVRALDRFSPSDAAACLLRYSIWSRAIGRAFEVPAQRLGVVYHNITPGRLLAAEQPAIAELCEHGRRELPSLAGRVSVAVADSRFNAAELERAGVSPVEVVPLLLDLPAGGARSPAAAVAPNVLTVGRIVPSKRVEEAIRALALLRARLPEARLEIVGGWDGFERYRKALSRFAERLGVSGAVVFHGRVSDARRDATYAEAGAYLCTSAHEGFCAPLVEAMARGVSVVAHDAGAVAETLGGAGLVIPHPDAALTAEALEAVLSDPEVRAALAVRAERRLEQLGPGAVEPQIIAAVRPLLDKADA